MTKRRNLRIVSSVEFSLHRCKGAIYGPLMGRGRKGRMGFTMPLSVGACKIPLQMELLGAQTVISRSMMALSGYLWINMPCA